MIHKKFFPMLFMSIIFFSTCATKSEDKKVETDLPAPERVDSQLHFKGTANLTITKLKLDSGEEELAVMDRVILVQLGSDRGCYSLWPKDFVIGELECKESKKTYPIYAGHALYNCQAPGVSITTYKAPFQGFSFACNGEASLSFYRFTEGVRSIEIRTCEELKNDQALPLRMRKCMQ